jgi:pimeloyl-ACP methyl ester carboxylesterase
MRPIRHRTVWVHVDVPGQGEGAPDLPADYHFPKMQEIGEDLVHVLDQLSIKEVVCFAEGAGANILVRFAMAHISRVLGICLIHTTGSAAGLLESLKDKVMKWKLDTFGMNHSAEQYLILHRFGSRFSQANDKDELKAIIEHYEDTLRHKINIRNLQMFVDVFLKRTSISDFIKALKCPVLLVTGQYSIFNVTTHYLHQVIVRTCEDKTKVEFVEVAGVANVIEEKPDKLAECFQYFLQGLGLVSSVPMHNVHKMSRNRTMSMEDYDKPMKERTTSLSTSPPRDDHPMTPEHSPTGVACPLATE